MIIVIRKKFVDIRGHCQVCKCHHRGSNGDKGVVQTKLLIGKESLFCKQVDIQQADGEANVDHNRGDDALPAYAAHVLVD